MVLFFAVVVLDCLLEVLLFSHRYMINKNKININVTARYFTHTTVAMTKLNCRSDPWWWKPLLEITKICSRCNNASM
jgi:hypothetical protein